MRIGLLVTTATAAAMVGGGAAGQGLSGENLLAGLPEGFVSGYDAAQNGQEIHELIPSGETVEDWSRMVTIQIFHGAANADVEGFGGRMAQGWEGACPGGVGAPLGSGEVNGYAYALWQFVCPLNPQTGKPEIMWMKAIAGADAAYVVQYAWRAAMSPDRETPALVYLETVSACDTRTKSHPCPAGM